MTICFSPDNPVASLEEDFLDYTVFANQIKNSIYNTKVPFVFGLLGDWARGKTSVLKLLELLISQDLDQNTNISNTKTDTSALSHLYVPIWFNAREYENQSNTIFPLLHAIRLNRMLSGNWCNFGTEKIIVG